MKLSNGTYVLIFLILGLWVALMVVIVLSQQSITTASKFTENVNYSTKPYTIEELIEMAEKNENLQNVQTPLEQDFHLSNNLIVKSKDMGIEIPSSDNIILGNENDIFENPYQDVIDTITENNLTAIAVDPNNVEIDSESILILEDVDSTIEVQIEPEEMKMFFGYTGLDFLDIYNTFEQNQNANFISKYIYNIPEVDEYIRDIAEARGYQRRSFANTADLIYFENIQTRPEVKSAYIAMRDEMSKQSIRLHFVSGYRTSISQRDIFTQKMNIQNPLEILTGIHDDVLDEVLSRSAIPAYSKHHSGYAVDFGCGNDYLVFSFADTPCYSWLSENNFENARRYGFIPSYPNDVQSQGPNPEPWEYVWVGVENAK